MSRIHYAAFHVPHPPREYLGWATSPNCRTTLALFQGEAVGFLTAEKRRDGRYGDFNIAVEPKFHGRGLGSALMERGLNDLIEMGCETAVADYWLQNAKVQALNRKYGFRIVRAYNYFETGDRVSRATSVTVTLANPFPSSLGPEGDLDVGPEKFPQ